MTYFPALSLLATNPGDDTVYMDTLGYIPTSFLSAEGHTLCHFAGESQFLGLSCATPVCPWPTWTSPESWNLPVRCLPWYTWTSPE